MGNVGASDELMNYLCKAVHHNSCRMCYVPLAVNFCTFELA